MGPTLFLIFINDLPIGLNSNIRIFADDTKIYRPIKHQNDTNTLQNDINALVQWSNKWKLPFNASKCVHIHLGSDEYVSDYFMLDKDNISKIDTSHCERDLGVFINDNLKPDDHIKTVSIKANYVLSSIRRSFTYIDKDIFIPLYKSLIRPILEYGSPVWNPYLIKDIVNLEKIQRRATKIVPECKDLSYTERLNFIGLPTLLYRRARQDLIQTYLILQDSKQTFFTLSTDSRTRGHLKKILKTECYNRNARLYFFTQRIINVWNSLPDYVVDSESLNIFKNNINNYNWNANKFVFPY